MMSTKSRSVFQSVRNHESLSTRIVNQVIETLFAKKLEPGEFLGTEAQLGVTFKTSRVSIRDALSRLKALGVVNIKTGVGGGVTIAEGDPDHFATALAVQFMLIRVTPGELFDARIAIECRAAELAAENITSEELVELHNLLEQIVSARSGRTGRTGVQRILAFHRAIVDASRSRTLITLMHALEHALLNLYMEIWPEQTGMAPQNYSSLAKILEQLEARDSEGAFRTMREHLAGRRQSVLDQLRSAAQLPVPTGPGRSAELGLDALPAGDTASGALKAISD
jgi:GntR family transcriptional repressor for pyruvate dehydrogenase complex